MLHFFFAFLFNPLNTMLRFLAPFLFAASIAATGTKVSVRFYGESQCPYCRKFVEEAWHEIWSDEELKSYIDYDFVPWGNAYFATTTCGSGPYDSKERACFYEQCITATTVDDDACFGGEPIYQHSTKEGQVDIYETCILQDVGLDAAVEFTYCAEGAVMDDATMSAGDLLAKCATDGVDPKNVQDCLEKRGRELEIENAKKTPVHPGVPFVLVGGMSVENPFETKKAICDKLQQQGTHPKACASARFSLRHTTVSLSI